MRDALRWGLLAVAISVFAVGQEPAPAPAAPPAEDFSGMYSFLQEGEFVQITVEDAGRVTGFISRYGDLDSDRGAFLDHFFKEGKLEDQKLTFTTQTVHGVFYEFKGAFERGPGKSSADEAYYILKGTLTQSTTGADKKVSSRVREVAFKSFPQEPEAPAATPAKPN